MVFKETEFVIKDGRHALLRSPREEDAEELLQFILTASVETDYLLMCPEDSVDLTLEKEKEFIANALNDQNGVMLTCFVEGKLAGNCQIAFRTGAKTRHRASVAIALLQEYWNLGIGTKMFEEMFRVAEERGGIYQIELEFIEGNNRARALYEKMGFRITGTKPNAIKTKDGLFVNEYMMVKQLQLFEGKTDD